MDGQIRLGIGLDELPDKTKRVRLQILAGANLEFHFYMSPREAEATGKALRDIAVQAQTNLVIPNEGLLPS